MCTDPVDTVLWWYYDIPILQPDNIKTMCQSVVETAGSSEMSLTTEAEEICHKLTDAFTLFANSHKIYDSSKLLSNYDILEY